MSDFNPTTEVDPIAEALRIAQEAERRGIDELRALRDRNVASRAARRAELERDQAIEDAEREHAEAVFARAEAEDTHRRAQKAAWSEHQTELDKYSPIAADADELVSRVHTLIATVVTTAGDAILKEEERDIAAKPLRAAHQRLSELDPENAPPLDIAPLRLHDAVARESAEDLLLLAVALSDPRFAAQRQAVIDVLHPTAPTPKISVGNHRIV